jgi:hypothetical protein
VRPLVHILRALNFRSILSFDAILARILIAMFPASAAALKLMDMAWAVQAYSLCYIDAQKQDRWL